MNKYRATYIFFIAALIIFAFGYQSRLSIVLLAAFVALPIVTLILLLISFLTCKISVAPQSIVVQKTQSFSVELKITNRFIIPLAPVRIFGMFQDEKDIRLEKKQVLMSIPPFKSKTISFGGSLKYRGEYFLGIERAEFYDLLKIWRFTKRFKPSARVVVIPRKLDVKSGTDTADSDIEHIMSRFSAYEKNSFSSIREYREGDSLRSVHWKLSAKQEELIVRELEQNMSSNAVIFCDLSGNAENNDIRCGQTDTAIETALAVTKACISESNTAVNVWYSEQNNSCISESIEDYERLFYMYSIAEADKNNDFTQTINAFTDYCKGSETIYIITSRIDEKLAECLKMAEIDMSRVKILAVNCGITNTAEYLAAETGAIICEIDENNLIFSIENAIRRSKA